MNTDRRPGGHRGISGKAPGERPHRPRLSAPMVKLGQLLYNLWDHILATLAEIKDLPDPCLRQEVPLSQIPPIPLIILAP